MERIVGREKEIRRLDKVMEESEAQLIIVYGRRRVGKTFLINEYYDNNFTFKFTGAYNQSRSVQLKNFTYELDRASREKHGQPGDWNEAFILLREYLEKDVTGEKQVVFFDEMPWMDTRRSGFLPAFEWFWNSWGSSRDNLVFIVCGSATSWIVDNIEKNKGGLFSRRTCRLFLEPFTLYETEEYLESRDIHWSRYDIAECYMIMGGIPYYLRLLDRELSLNENIDNMFFRKRAELWDEFDQLFDTLFSKEEQYAKLVEALSRKRKGLTRTEIINTTRIAVNGRLTKMLDNLSNAGFIRVNQMFGKKKRERLYQLSDYFTMFYFRFMKDNVGIDEHFWSNTNDNPARHAWEGITFEQVCKDHIPQIKQKLGIAGIMAETSSWAKQGTNAEEGAQIDLLIDRRDRIINLCEIKFSTAPFEIDKEYDLVLKDKAGIFRESTGTKKTLQTTMITTYGIKKNKYSNYIGKSVVLDDLFANTRD
ncbi:MAG: ATP-binding protein [Lachnospiraceae bacterium]|nr:ATP-binding protein [Lachnospiraceae bacterium]